MAGVGMCVDLSGAALANASGTCTYCAGSGQVTRKRGGARVCNCVYRRVAVRAMRRYRYVRRYGPEGKCRVSRGASGHLLRGFPDAEFAADVEMAARSLSVDDLRVFALYEAGGLPWAECARIVGCARGKFFHAVYRVEREIGKQICARGVFPASRWITEEMSGKQMREEVQV